MRLNIGCGNQRPVGWVNVDPNPHEWDAHDTWPAGVIAADPRDPEYEWPFEPDTFDGAVCHHVLQMLTYPELVPWLTVVRTSMKPGAVLRVTVPDMLGAFDAYDEAMPDWFPDELEESIDGKLCTYLSQCGATRSVFTGPWLAELLGRAGFDRITQYESWAEPASLGPEWLMALDTRLDESVLVEGVA
jgi:hypothetical protein